MRAGRTGTCPRAARVGGACRPRPSGGARTAARPAGARGGRGGASQPAPDRPAGIGQDDAGTAPPRHPAAARAARVARDHPHPLRGGPARTGHARALAALPGAASQRLGCRVDRKRPASPRRGEPRARRRPVHGRAPGVHAPGARRAADAARGAPRPSGPRARRRHAAGRLHRRRGHEPVPLRHGGRPGSRVHVLTRAPCRIRRTPQRAAPRPVRPAGRGAEGGGSRRSRRAVRSGREAGRRRPPVLAAGPPAIDPSASALLDRAVAGLFLSGRGADRARRVAATIAALAGLDRVAEEHMAEALSFRGAAG